MSSQCQKTKGSAGHGSNLPNPRTFLHLLCRSIGAFVESLCQFEKSQTMTHVQRQFNISSPRSTSACSNANGMSTDTGHQDECCCSLALAFASGHPKDEICGVPAKYYLSTSSVVAVSFATYRALTQTQGPSTVNDSCRLVFPRCQKLSCRSSY